MSGKRAVGLVAAVLAAETCLAAAPQAEKVIEIAPGVHRLSELKLGGRENRRIVGKGAKPSETVFVGDDGRRYEVPGNTLFENLTFRDYASTNNGAVFASTKFGGRYAAKNCVFENCRTEATGAVAFRGSFENCVFRNCRAGEAGGALRAEGGDRIVSCRFENCRAGRNGGALRLIGVYTGFTAVSNCTFVGCAAEDGIGGAIYATADPRGKHRIVGCRFEGCAAAMREPGNNREYALGWSDHPYKDGALVLERNEFVKSAPVPTGAKGGTCTRIVAQPGDDLVAVRDRLRATRKPGARAEVVLADGVYRLDRELRLTERDADTTWRAEHPGKAIVVGGWNFRGRDARKLADGALKSRIPAEAREKVVAIEVPAEVRPFLEQGEINGGQPTQIGLRGSYRGYEANGIGWCAHYPTYPVLSVGLRYMELARWPNGDDYMTVDRKSGSLVRPGTSRTNQLIRVAEGRRARWRFEGANIHASGFLRGCEYSNELATVKPSAEGEDLVEVTSDNKHEWGRYRFINILEEIDVPGEWCYDRASGTIVFYPPEGFGPDSLCALGTAFESFFRVFGARIDIDGLVFTAKVGHPAVCVEGADGVRVRGCRFTALEWWAAFVSGWACEVRSCDFEHLPAHGLFLAGGDEVNLKHAKNRIENCRFTDYGFKFTSWSLGAAWVEGCGNMMRHCEVSDSLEQGFEWHGVDNLIEYNRVHDVSYWWSDAGGVYTGGGILASYGNVCRYNDIAASPGYVNGIYCDDESSGNRVYGNIVRNFGYRGLFTGGGRDNEYSNNIVVADEGWGIHLDLRGLAWKQLIAPTAVTSIAKRVQAKWPPETSPVVKRYPRLGEWTKGDWATMLAPWHDSWHDNVVIGLRSSEVGTGANKMRPEFGLSSTNNLQLRVVGGPKAAAHWSLGGFECVDGTTNAPLDVGIVDLPVPEKHANGRRSTWRKGDFNLKPDSIILRKLPNFKPIPFDKIGLYKDEWRTSLPGGEAR